MSQSVILDAGDANPATVVLRAGAAAVVAAASVVVALYSSPSPTTVVLHPTGETPADVGRPYQTGVRSRRPFTGVIFQRGRQADPCPPVRFDAAASSTSTGPTVTFAHTNAGDFLLVSVDSFFAAGVVSGVTYNGVSLAPLGSISSAEPRQSMWGLVAPSIGTFNVVVTFAGAASPVFAASMSFFDVNQSSPTGTYASNTASSSMSLSVVSPDTDARGLIAAIVGDFSGSVITPTTGTTRASSGPSASAVTTQSGSAATNSFTFSGNDNSTASCILIRPAPCGGTPAKAMPFTIVSRYAVQRARLTARPTGEVAQAPPGAKAMPLTVVTATAGEAREARARTTDFVSAVVYLRGPAKDGSTRPRVSQATVVLAKSRPRRSSHVTLVRNPQVPVAVPPAKAMPFTIVSQMAVQRARLTARPTGEVAQTPPPPPQPKPVIVSQRSSRRTELRRVGRASFSRVPPASFDDAGSIPITVVVQQSRQFFRRPTSRVTFVRNPQVPVVVPPAKAPPLTVISTTAGEAREARARTTDFVSNVVYLRNPAKYATYAQHLVQITVVSQTPERAARRPKTSTYVLRRKLIPISSTSFPCYIVVLLPRPTTVVLSARPATVTLSVRQTTFNINAMR